MRKKARIDYYEDWGLGSEADAPAATYVPDYLVKGAKGEGGWTPNHGSMEYVVVVYCETLSTASFYCKCRLRD